MTAEITIDDYRRYQRTGELPPALQPDRPPAAPPKRKRPLRPKAGEQNATEAAYAAELEAQRQAGEIAWYMFEPLKLRLAQQSTYTPDFLVVGVDGRLALHEVKGFWRDDARVKIRVAARLFPCFEFLAVTKARKKEGGGWRVERFAAH